MGCFNKRRKLPVVSKVSLDGGEFGEFTFSMLEPFDEELFLGDSEVEEGIISLPPSVLLARLLAVASIFGFEIFKFLLCYF